MYNKAAEAVPSGHRAQRPPSLPGTEKSGQKVEKSALRIDYLKTKVPELANARNMRLF